MEMPPTFYLVLLVTVMAAFEVFGRVFLNRAVKAHGLWGAVGALAGFFMVVTLCLNISHYLGS